jgi:hypothetical protein
MTTEHFKIYTGYVSVTEIYKLLQTMAEGWQERQITKIRVFHANFTDVYLSITASRWYHWSDGNDPDWKGDAQDYITDGVFRYNYRHLASKPYPEKRWQGDWREFNTPDEMRAYTQKMLDGLAERAAQ